MAGQSRLSIAQLNRAATPWPRTQVIAADIAAGKSIVHKLDGVLVSPEVARLIVELSAGGGASPAPSPSGTPSSANYSSVLAALSSNTDLIGFNVGASDCARCG